MSAWPASYTGAGHRSRRFPRREPRRLPEDQRQAVDVADTELTAAVEGRVEILVEPDLDTRVGAECVPAHRLELPRLEQLIEIVHAVREEPQAHAARPGVAARTQSELGIPERQLREH